MDLTNEIQELIELFQTGKTKDAEKAAIMAEQLGLIEQFEDYLGELKSFFENLWKSTAKARVLPLLSTKSGSNPNVSKEIQAIQKSIRRDHTAKQVSVQGIADHARKYWILFNASFRVRWETIFSLEYLDLQMYKGSLPKQLILLKKLKEVDVQGNQGFVLDDSIEYLGRVQKLNLSARRKTVLPKAIGSLAWLRELNLSSSGVGRLPDEIGELKQLKRLYLGSSFLTELPNSIGSLEQLQELELNSNKLEELPDSIGNLKKLRILNLNRTNLMVLPKSIGELKKLEELYLEGNELTQIPMEIGGATFLRVLKLSKNRIANLPTSIGKLKRLKTLDLSQNKLMSIPVELGQLKKLKELNLYRNGADPKPQGFLKKAYYFFVENNKLYEDDIPKEVLALRENGCKILI